MSSAKAKKNNESNWKLTGSWAGAWKVSAGIGVLGLVGAGIGFTQNAERFAFSWLFAFITVLTIALGALFFVLIQHLTAAGWSVTVRRTAEFFSLGLVALVPLFLPVLLTMNQLFPWLHDHAAAPAEQVSPSGPPAHGHLGLIKPAYAQEPAQEPAQAQDQPQTQEQAQPEPAAPPPAEAQPQPAQAAAQAQPQAEEQPQAQAEALEEQAPAPGQGPEADPHPILGPGTHGEPAPPDTTDPAGMLPGASAGVPGDYPEPGARVPPTPAHPAAAEAAHHVAEQKMLEHKKPYLNRTFFLIRAAFYLVVWGLIATRLFRWSTTQDESKDPKLTIKAQRFAPPATFLYALTLTFAAFDWIMSLEPTWFSTIFGVVIFSAGVVASLAVIILVTLKLRASGPLDGAVTVEHYHDLGKLMFGFLVFWAYVSFSQYMLIWYAAIPEETTFFHYRWNYAPWATVSKAIVVVKFVLPFFWTMSRNFKRNVGRLQLGAIVLLVMHVVDMYWYVMPNFHLGKPGFTFHWMDLACLLAVGGLYAAFVFHRMTQFALVPIGDPRLKRSLAFLNA